MYTLCTKSLLLKDLTHLKESSCVKSLKRWNMYIRVAPSIFGMIVHLF